LSRQTATTHYDWRQPLLIAAIDTPRRQII
jgi:hypothetical protein